MVLLSLAGASTYQIFKVISAPLDDWVSSGTDYLYAGFLLCSFGALLNLASSNVILKLSRSTRCSLFALL